MRPLKVLVNGYTGSGKSYHILTYPKVAWLILEPGSDILLDTHPELAKNVVMHETFIPSPSEPVKSVRDRLLKKIDEVHKAYAEGKIETLGFDNFTYFSALEWEYINQHEKVISRNGEVDTRGMYGVLRRKLFNFTLTKLLSFPGHCVVSCHEQVESDEAMEKKTDKTTPIVPNIRGGFREEIAGMFSASIYLDKRRFGEGKYKYLARCQKGGQREAKNRLNLPEIVENVSYKAIVSSINGRATGGNT